MPKHVSNAQIISDELVREFLPDGVSQDGMSLTAPGSLANSPGDLLQQQTEEVIQEQLSGSIPTDVQNEVQRISAEQSISSGIGQGQASRNLTTRDLGLTSIEIQQQGIQNAQTSTQIREEQRQWNEQFLLAAQGLHIEETKVGLAGLELISNNQQTTMKLTNELLIANSRKRIRRLQGNLDTLIGVDDEPGFLETTNVSILDYLEGRT